MKSKAPLVTIQSCLRSGFAALALAILAPTSTQAQIKAYGYTTPSYIDFESSEVVVSESQTNVTLTVIRTGEFRTTTKIDYVANEITASAGQDYQATGGTLVFQPGEGYKTISIPILPDTERDPDETFSVELTTSNPNVQFFRQSAVVTIQDQSPSIASLPRLKIQAEEGAMIRLSWNAAPDQFVLERAPSTATANWQKVAAAPQYEAGSCHVREEISGDFYVYRLRSAN